MFKPRNILLAAGCSYTDKNFKSVSPDVNNELDGHPNGEAQSIIANLFQERWEILYG